MKWLVVLVVVLFAAVPVSAEHPVVGAIMEDWGVKTQFTKERENGSVFGIVANKQDLNAVRGTVRLYLKPDVVIEQIEKVRCGIVIDHHQVSDISEYLIEGNHGPELWFPHIPKGVLAELAMYVKKFPPELYAMTFEVTSDEGDKAYVWESEYPYVQIGIKSFVGYRGVTLNEFCQSDTTQEVAKKY